MNLIRRALNVARIRWLASRYSIGASGYKRIYFYHVQKAGGTSIRHAFYDLGHSPERAKQLIYSPTERRGIIDNKIYVTHHSGMLNQGYYFFGSSHLPISIVQPPEKTFTFTCLRHPIKRFLSRYRELVYLQQNQPDSFHVQHSRHWFSEDFMKMMENVPDEELLFQLRMFSARYDIEEAIENVRGLSYFFLTGDIAHGIQSMAQELDLAIQNVHTRKTRYDFQPPPEQLAYLEQRLQPEIEMYDRLEKIYYQNKSNILE